MFQISFGGISTDFQIYQIFYVILAVLGIYLIRSVRTMKRKEELNSFIIPGEELAKCRDRKGFIEEIAKSMLVFGIITLLYGVFGMGNSLFCAFGWGYELIGIFLFFTAYGWFSKELRKGIEKYCR